MTVLKWQICHKAEVVAIQDLFRKFGFSPLEDNPYRMTSKVADYCELKVSIASEAVTFYIWGEEESATGMYFDYLLEVGTIMGQLKVYVESLPVYTETQEGDSDVLDPKMSQDDSVEVYYEDEGEDD